MEETKAASDKGMETRRASALARVEEERSLYKLGRDTKGSVVSLNPGVSFPGV